MTRDEIKKWLKNLKEDIGQPQHHALWHYEEAIDMAIEALSAETPTIQEKHQLSEVDTQTVFIDGIGHFPKLSSAEVIKKLEEFAPLVVDDTREAIEIAIEALQFAKHFDLLKEFQSLQEVVRCKDCKHRDEKCGMGERRWCRILKMSTVPNDFCSYGERKGGDTE